jgi:hypothetical protein
MPADALELGRLLVKELNVDSGTDTLGRWMAHHVAELISAIEAAPNENASRKRRKDAFEAIARLWTHRSTYENRINPLFELKPILQVMGMLDPARNVYVLRNDTTRNVYDIFRRLMICLLFRNAESLSRARAAISRAKATSRFQTSEERALIANLDFWLEGALSRPSAKARRKSSKSNKVEDVNLDEAIEALIAQARKALDALGEEIARGRTKARNDIAN